jgi:hypothetical protein
MPAPHSRSLAEGSRRVGTEPSRFESQKDFAARPLDPAKPGFNLTTYLDTFVIAPPTFLTYRYPTQV